MLDIVLILLFLASNGVIWIGKRMPPISEDILIYFHTTIKLYLCGIRFHYVKSNCEHPFDSAHESTILRLNMIMRDVKRIQGEHNPKQRLPITFQVLERICNSFRSGVFSTFTDYMIETVCTVAFCFFFEVWEFTILQNFDPTTNLCVADVEIFYSYANLPLKASKSDPFRKGVTIQLHISNHNICPLSVFKKYLAVRSTFLPFRSVVH